MTEPLSPAFRRTIDLIDNRLVLKPLVEAYLAEARFPDRFTVTFHKAGQERKPDGYFHASTHPLWPARILYYYLTAPEKMIGESLSYESRMAVTMGTAVHGFVQMCLRDAGYMVPLPDGDCVACGRVHGTGPGQCDEFGVLDPQVGTRGHMDGILKIALEGKFWEPTARGLFEFKTMNPNKGRGIADLDLEWFIAKCPDYYVQVLEYMAASGLRQCIVLIALLGFPWKLVEIQVPYDEAAAEAVRDRYRLARTHASLGTPPPPCCAPLSVQARNCPARLACPIGRMRHVADLRYPG